MNKRLDSLILILVTGFSIFTMLFGAGNFMIPPTMGILAGQKSLLAALSFSITAVLLPLMGLIGSFLFDGNYRAFFFRAGPIAGSILIALCMFITGPGLILPRIINICYEMLHPFLPYLTLLNYAVIMATVSFALSYKPSRLIGILGYIITPIKLSFISIFIIAGFVNGYQLLSPEASNLAIVGDSLLFGYETLDLLALIFLGSIILDAFKRDPDSTQTKRMLLKKGIAAACVGGALLIPIYIGMTFLGAYNGIGLEGLNPGQVLSALSFRVIGIYGGLFAAIALVIACLATMIALSTVVAKYIDRELLKSRLGFIPSLLFVLISSVVVSLFGLSQLMVFSRNLGFVLYPVVITLTLCNVAYKLAGFKPVKIPVFIALIVALFFQFDGMHHLLHFIG